ncbi:MAG: GerMN domain-containing protein [Deltaproteobacteria bacterium]|nr:GerMN domain-containing protein [Deltaproteobacteria bacterium]
MAGKKGKKSLTAIIVIAAITVIAGIIVLSWLAGGPAKKEMKDITVFFSDEDGIYLKAEKQQVKKGALDMEAAEAVQALINGPQDAKSGKTLPNGTKLLSVRIDGQVAIVDLSPEVMTNHEGGSSGELQTIYSIVNTLALSFPEIKEVQILVAGNREETIAGHIDITTPLGPDRKIIKD